MDNLSLPELPKRRFTDRSITEYMSKREAVISSDEVKRKYETAYSQIDEARDRIKKRLEMLKTQKENLMLMKDDDVRTLNNYNNHYSPFPNYGFNPFQNQFYNNPYMGNYNIMNYNRPQFSNMERQFHNPMLGYNRGFKNNEVTNQIANEIRFNNNEKKANHLKGMRFDIGNVETGQPAEIGKKNQTISSKDIINLVGMYKQQRNNQNAHC